MHTDWYTFTSIHPDRHVAHLELKMQMVTPKSLSTSLSHLLDAGFAVETGRFVARTAVALRLQQLPAVLGNHPFTLCSKGPGPSALRSGSTAFQPRVLPLDCVGSAVGTQPQSTCSSRRSSSASPDGTCAAHLRHQGGKDVWK